MGECAKLQPKCMTILKEPETILSRQLQLIKKAGIQTVVITTGGFDQVIRDYCITVEPELRYIFVKNPIYDKTNYIYSMYLAEQYLDDDLLLMHGDLVFEDGIIQDMMKTKKSVMAVCKSQPLPQKDFKAIIHENIIEIGIDCFEDAYAVQPLYCLQNATWKIWRQKIREFCENGQVNCYAENAFNEVSDCCLIYPHEVGEHICGEVDTQEDLYKMRERI